MENCTVRKYEVKLRNGEKNEYEAENFIEAERIAENFAKAEKSEILELVSKAPTEICNKKSSKIQTETITEDDEEQEEGAILLITMNGINLKETIFTDGKTGVLGMLRDVFGGDGNAKIMSFLEEDGTQRIEVYYNLGKAPKVSKINKILCRIHEIVAKKIIATFLNKLASNIQNDIMK